MDLSLIQLSPGSIILPVLYPNLFLPPAAHPHPSHSTSSHHISNLTPPSTPTMRAHGKEGLRSNNDQNDNEESINESMICHRILNYFISHNDF